MVEPLDLQADPAVEIGARHALDDGFRSYLESSAQWGAVLSREDPVPAGALVYTVTPRVSQRHSVSRTYVLDVLLVMTMGLVPFGLSWGEVEVEVSIAIRRADGRPIADPLRSDIQAPHSTVVYGAFRADEIEAAFRKAYGRAFADTSRALVAAIEVELANTPPSIPMVIGEALLAATSSTSSIAVTSSAAVPRALAVFTPPPAVRVYLEPNEFDVLTRPLAHQDDDDALLARYVGALGGVEMAAFRGGAQVESRTFTVNGPDEVVGSGRAETTGYRFSFFRPPDRTGFFFPPSIGLLWQDITITGFRDAIPLARTGDIPAVPSDPKTGVGVDLGAPLSYDLRLRSGYLGQGIGLNLVAGTDDVQLFFTLQGHVNLVEIRYVGVTVGVNEVEGTQAVGFRSAGFELQGGLVFPGAHLALRGLLQSESFFEFDFPQPVEFQAGTRFNPDKEVFERQRAFVRGASLWTYNAQVSISYLF